MLPFFLLSDVFTRRSAARTTTILPLPNVCGNTACVENGCENPYRLFCDVADVTYGGLRKIGFTRTKTLGYGGDCCDFHFLGK